MLTDYANLKHEVLYIYRVIQMYISGLYEQNSGNLYLYKIFISFDINYRKE